MQNNIYGYIRISTADQHDDRQRIALAPFEIPTRNLYVDKQSGKDFERPAYKRLLKRLHSGDILYLKSIDRLGRNYAEIIEQWRFITREKGSDIKVLDMPLLDTTYYKDLLGTFIADLVLQVLSFTAQLERETMLARQAEGITAAKARGIKFGRHPLSLPENFQDIHTKWRLGKITAQQVATLCKMSRRTLYTKVKELYEKKLLFRN